MQTLVQAPLSDGGQWDMVYNLVTKYGLGECLIKNQFPISARNHPREASHSGVWHSDTLPSLQFPRFSTLTPTTPCPPASSTA